jgi:hypothetical protein
MIAAIEMPDKLCLVRWVGRVGLRVKILAACGAEADVATCR